MRPGNILDLFVCRKMCIKTRAKPWDSVGNKDIRALKGRNNLLTPQPAAGVYRSYYALSGLGEIVRILCPGLRPGPYSSRPLGAEKDTSCFKQNAKPCSGGIN